LGIDDETSEDYRVCVVEGHSGIKPGWCRVSMHYVMDDLEVDFLLDAVDFVAKHGELFLSLYDFDLNDGSWNKKSDPSCLQRFSLESALEAGTGRESPMSFEERQSCYRGYLEDATKLAGKLQKKKPSAAVVLDGKLAGLQFFALKQCCIEPAAKKPAKGLVGKLKGMFSQ
jgi:hypothetical protein